MDIRLYSGFFDHPKTRKLLKHLRQQGVLSLLRLWLWVAEHRPDGRLTGLGDKDIAAAAGWKGDAVKFAAALSDCGFLRSSDDGGVSVLHEWISHQQWAAHGPARKARAVANAKLRWDKRLEISPDAISNAEGNAIGNAPTPTPTPTPNPQPTPKEELPADAAFEKLVWEFLRDAKPAGLGLTKTEAGWCGANIRGMGVPWSAYTFAAVLAATQTEKFQYKIALACKTRGASDEMTVKAQKFLNILERAAGAAHVG